MDLNKLKKLVDIVLAGGDTIDPYGKDLQQALLREGETHGQFTQDLVNALSPNPTKIKLLPEEMFKLVKRMPHLKKYPEILKHFSSEQQGQLTSLSVCVGHYPMLAEFVLRVEADMGADETDYDPANALQSDDPKIWVEALQWIIDRNGGAYRDLAAGLLEEIANRIE
jgi:hypothetical protein